MNWFDNRSFLRHLSLLGAVAAIAAITFCPAQAASDKEDKPKSEKKEKSSKGEKKKKESKEDKGKKDSKDAKGSKEGKSKKDGKKKKGETDITDSLPIPIGHGWEGIKVPHMDENGRLQMNFQIGAAFRENELDLKMENLKIETFDVQGNLDMVVDMPKSVMNMQTRVLTSVDPIQIHRQDFKIVGGNVTFNTQTRFGTFKGPVRMLIFNRNF